MKNDDHAIYIKTDKSNKVIISDRSDYINKMNVYINDMDCEILTKDPYRTIFKKTQ